MQQALRLPVCTAILRQQQAGACVRPRCCAGPRRGPRGCPAGAVGVHRGECGQRNGPGGCRGPEPVDAQAHQVGPGVRVWDPQSSCGRAAFHMHAHGSGADACLGLLQLSAGGPFCLHWGYNGDALEPVWPAQTPAWGGVPFISRLRPHAGCCIVSTPRVQGPICSWPACSGRMPCILPGPADRHASAPDPARLPTCRLSSLYQVTKRAGSNPSLSPRASLDSSRGPGKPGSVESIMSGQSARSAKSSIRSRPKEAAPAAQLGASTASPASPFQGYSPFSAAEAQAQQPAAVRRTSACCQMPRHTCGLSAATGADTSTAACKQCLAA